jgi:hypothetical protein
MARDAAVDPVIAARGAVLVPDRTLLHTLNPQGCLQNNTFY